MFKNIGNREPELEASINALSIRKPVDALELESTVYLSITNDEDKDTFIKIKTFEFEIPGVDRRTAQIKVDKHLYVDKFRSINDTISFRLPQRLWVKSDTVSVRFDSISVSCDLYYPSGKVAKRAKFNLEPKDLKMFFTWWPLPEDKYYDLHDESIRNKLPREWKRVDVNFRGQIYDCYYTPSSMELKIGFSGETFRVYPRDETGEFQEIKLGVATMVPLWSFVANPRIEDRFVELKKRGMRFMREEGEQRRIVSGEFEVWFEQGYSYAYFVRP